MPERRRGSTGWLYTQGLLFAMVLIALLSTLSGCGPEQTNVGQTNGNNVPVSLSISMPQESAAASTSGSRFWATVQSWLPSVTNAWAVTYDLSELTVSVTDSDQQLLATKTEKISSSHDSGESISIDLDVPVGSDRIFAVSGIDRGSGLPILQGKSNPVTLIEGKPATVPITLADVGQPTISDPPSLPVGVVGTPYSATLTATGGTPPYTWSVTPPLPARLTFSPTGPTATIGGTPGTARTTNHTFSVTDSTSPTPRTGTRSYSVTITTGSRPPIITTPSPLPTGTVNQAYPPTTLTATGGAPPLKWNPVVTPPLPNGLTFDPNKATISGTPLSASQPTTHTFTVQDSTAPSNQTGTKGLLLTINSALTIDTTTLPNGTTTQDYSATVIASGGTPPYRWSIADTDPTPAPGLTLRTDDNEGIVQGTPKSAGSYKRTYRVQDSKGDAFIKSLTLSVSDLMITTTKLPSGRQFDDYSATLQATGGTGALTWTISANALPPGLTLNQTTGVISGEPTSGGTYNFTVQATDALLQFDSQDLSIFLKNHLED